MPVVRYKYQYKISARQMLKIKHTVIYEIKVSYITIKSRVAVIITDKQTK